MGYFSYLRQSIQERNKLYYRSIQKHQYKFKEADVKLIAFYLPQFHPFPENDQWWGKGFTEWTNVTKAQPWFQGHDQPRLPGELGYYNLLTEGVMERQVELAKMYGIYGFCFYFYMFNNKHRLMEKPLDKFLKSNIKMPFCICYANENWTKRWDGLDQDVLIKMTYSKSFVQDLASEIAPCLKDSRYIRIDGKPLFIIYKAALIPKIENFVVEFRNECRKIGIGEIYLTSVLSWIPNKIFEACQYGFDDNLEFPPHRINTESVSTKNFHKDFSGFVYHYKNVIRHKLLETVNFKAFRGVMPGWDNTARISNRACVAYGATPDLYKIWLQYECYKTRMERRKEERFVFVNAWNEWAEGAYLEPDRKYGYAYLQATYDALKDQKKDPRVEYKNQLKDDRSIAKVNHLTYRILRKIKRVVYEFCYYHKKGS